MSNTNNLDNDKEMREVTIDEAIKGATTERIKMTLNETRTGIH